VLEMVAACRRQRAVHRIHELVGPKVIRHVFPNARRRLPSA
jgi:hypothetical protein